MGSRESGAMFAASSQALVKTVGQGLVAKVCCKLQFKILRCTVMRAGKTPGGEEIYKWAFAYINFKRPKSGNL